jgi:hypothetical protein
MKYRSGVFFVAAGENIKTDIQNPDGVAHNFRVVVRSMSPVTIVLDSGTLNLLSDQYTHQDYSPGGGSDFSVEVIVDSDKLIPTVSVVLASGIPRLVLAGSQFRKSEE